MTTSTSPTPPSSTIQTQVISRVSYEESETERKRERSLTSQSERDRQTDSEKGRDK